MLQRAIFAVCVCTLMFVSSGCALIGTALSAGAAYGIYQATHR